jgi:tetratricopeptide (TPR) repeat protein
MSPKKIFAVILAVMLTAVAGLEASAQTAALRGKVELVKEGGNTPVQGVLVEVFRMDIKAKFPTSTTDRRGNFTFAGIPLGSVYALAVSGPGFAPEVVPNVRAGMESLVITVKEGDGRRLTEDEVRQVIERSKTQGGEESADDKKARAEFEAKVKEVEEKNKKAATANEIVTRSLTEGSKAFGDKDYTTAITKFQEGIDADPTFVGSAPVLLNNKAISLNSRATDTYNASVKDPSNRASLRESAKSDLEAAIIAVDQSLAILREAQPSDDSQKKSIESTLLQGLTARKNAYRLLAQTGLEIGKGKEAATAFSEYLQAETDPAKKSRGQIEMAQTLQDSGEYELAFAEFEKIAETDPNNVDALVGMGLNLITIGYVSQETDAAKGKQQLQEAANYLQRYVDVAPDGHRFKEDAKAAIEQLKQDAKVVPQRNAPVRTQPRRRN